MKYTKQPNTSRVLTSYPSQKMRFFPRQVLIVEDERTMQDQLEFLFADLDMQVHVVDSLNKAQQYVLHHKVELVILDRGLPDGDGLDLLKISDASVLPCVILSARTALTDRIRGLRLGPVAYLPKPFSREELKLQVHRLLQLRYGLPDQEMGDEDVQFFPNSGQVKSQDQTFQVPRREAQLLTILLKHSGQVLTKSQIIQQIWQHQIDQPNDETIEVYVRRLRSKLPPMVRDRVETIRGYGYRFRAKE